KSVSILKSALDDFGAVSGLLPSMPKSTVLFGNVKDAAKSRILKVMPLTVGTLPVRYLGVSLISNRLFSKDCQPLIDKIHYSGLFVNSKIADVIDMGRWIWPKTSTDMFDGLLKIDPPSLDSGKANKVMWKNNAGKNVDFAVSNVWHDIRKSKQAVPWAKMVWLKVLGLTINDTYQVAEATKIWDFHVKRGMGKKK
ncbi:hypothetical protein Tco_1095831, partial [Tanacetum coccineum]